MARLKELTATGNVSSTETIYVSAIVLTGGSAASTLVLKDGGASGTVVLSIKAAIDTTVVVPISDKGIPVNTAHATLTGAAATVSFIYS